MSFDITIVVLVCSGGGVEGLGMRGVRSILAED